jgi:hypothetical protein
MLNAAPRLKDLYSILTKLLIDVRFEEEIHDSKVTRILRSEVDLIAIGLR